MWGEERSFVREVQKRLHADMPETREGGEAGKRRSLRGSVCVGMPAAVRHGA